MSDSGLKKIAFIVIGLMMVNSHLFGQSKAIDLWDGNIPGAISNESFNQVVDSSDNWTRMKFVTNPILDVYPAPKEIATGTAVIICPGGGYSILAIEHEGADVAKWLNGLGITAFVLKYRLPDDSIMENKAIGPLQDAQRAMRIVRGNAKEWGINPDKIGIMGFSAGGHLASTLSTHYNEKVYESMDTTSARPDFSLLIYPVISMQEGITHLGSRYNLLGESPSSDQTAHFSNELHVNGDTPPAFLVHSMDDGAVPVQNSIIYAMAMQKNKIPCELHIYQSGGHGYGMGRSTNTESTWTEACQKWLDAKGLL